MDLIRSIEPKEPKTPQLGSFDEMFSPRLVVEQMPNKVQGRL